MRVEITFAGNPDEAVVSAEAVSTALKSLGLTATTTSTSINSMATATNTLSSASTRAIGVHQAHTKELQESGRAARGAAASFLDLGRAAAFASTAFLGGALIGGTLKQIVDRTREADDAQSSLQTSVVNTGAAWSVYSTQTGKVISAQSDLSKFTKTDLTQALARLVLSTGSVTKGEQDLAIATNLARASHESLSEAETQLGQIQSGRLTTLRGLGISTTAVTTAHQKLNAEIAALKANHEKLTPAELAHAQALATASDRAATAAKMLDLVRSKVQGADAQFAKTSAGSSANFSRSLDEIEVAIGRGVVPEIDQVINKAANYANELVKTGTAQRDAKATADALKTAIHDAAAVIHDIDDVTGSFGNTLKILIGIKVATTLAGWVSGFQGFGASLGMPVSRTQALSTNLTNLAKMGALTIGITTLINGLQTPGPKGFFEQLFGAGAVGWALGGPAGAMVSITADILYNFLKKPGSPDPNNPASPDYTYTIGKYKGYGVAAKGAPGDTEIGLLLKKADSGGILTKDQQNELLTYIKQHLRDGSFLSFKSLAGVEAFYKDSNLYNVATHPNATSPTAPTKGVGVGNTGASEMSAGKQKMLAFAKDALGKPYLWGGSGPSAFDCSGLVMWAFSNGLGVDLPHSTYDQVTMGKQVSTAKAAVGDVVFTNYGESGKAGPGHEGLIVGFKNGQPIIEAAPHTGANVQTYTGYSSFTGGNKFTIRDLLAGTTGGTGGDTSNAGSDYAGSHGTPIPQAWQLPKGLQLAIARSSTTTGNADDIKALRNAIAYINAHMPKSLDDEISAYQEIATLQSQLKSLTKVTGKASTASLISARTAATGLKQNLGTNVFAGIVPDTPEQTASGLSGALANLANIRSTYGPKVKEAAAEIQKALVDGTMSSSALSKLRAQMSSWQKVIADATSKAKTAASSAAQQFQSIWSTMASDAESEFDKTTQAWVSPAQQLINQLQDQHDTDALNKALDQANQDLATALQGHAQDAQSQLDQIRQYVGQQFLANAIDATQSAILGGPSSQVSGQSILSTLQGLLAGGNVVDPKEVATAQQEVEDAKYNITIAGLQKTAQSQQDAWDAQRAAQRVVLDNMASDWGTYYTQVGGNIDKVKQLWITALATIDPAAAAALGGGYTGTGGATPYPGVTPPSTTLGTIAPGSTVAQAAGSSTSFAQFSAWARANHIPGFAAGADFITAGPTPFMAGEGGRPERVTVTPIRDGSYGVPGSQTGDTHVHLYVDEDGIGRYITAKVVDAAPAMSRELGVMVNRRQRAGRYR